ncbi:MAG TPA: class I SAM-dependent methyltransferase [Nitrospiraceae bacterium]|nr:class I SAM-dependent methyltransferase [Nitrospiraceae bacterium]
MSADLQASLADHLRKWGLRRFESDQAYFRWQRETLPAKDIAELNRLVEQKRASASVGEEIAFYDFTAKPHILPVLYSQRYDYYLAVGPLVAERIGGAKSILDFGCGVGLLTTFYARQFPDRTFVGVDRSAASVAVAQERAAILKLTNVRFECLDLQQGPLTGTYDLIVATHALLQAEQDLGLPSLTWQTFERGKDPVLQSAFEQRTGLSPRLDLLCAALTPEGRFITFEKTRLLARRIPFQRALAARGLRLLEPPRPIRYLLVEEVSDDGPLYVLGLAPSQVGIAWDESPEMDASDRLDLSRLKHKTVAKDEPLFENHRASAQRIWTQLPGRQVLKETTRQEPDGRQMHVELGTMQNLTYLYFANTFDQRQLVIMDSERASLLEQYYQELLYNCP